MLNLQTFQTLLQNMTAAAQSATSTVLDFAVGTVLRALYQGVASAILWLQYLVLQVLQQAFLSSSTGSQIDYWLGSNFPAFGGRLPAVAATGAVTVGRYTATSSAFIPVGAQFRTADGTQTFSAVADTTQPLFSAALNGYTLPAGQSTGNVTVQAVTAGTGANVAANTISQIVGSLPGIDYVNNATAFTNGEAAESDAAVQARFQNWQQTRASGTYAAIAYAVQQSGANLTYAIIQNTTQSGYTPGSFTVVVDDGSGNTPASTVSTVFNAIENVRPIGTTAYVQAATSLQVSVSMTVTMQTGYQKPPAQAAIATAVTAFINALPVGAALPYSRLSQVAYDAYPGVANITQLTANGGAADIVPTQYQVVRASLVTVN
jgi:uncharacterized phage protein gp47/JayE